LTPARRSGTRVDRGRRAHRSPAPRLLRRNSPASIRRMSLRTPHPENRVRDPRGARTRACVAGVAVAAGTKKIGTITTT
ncbi:MAG: hypothetical protein J0L91_13055, partial [Burkholderiales bacterium]|nr:hypothetical protein [Burkholderiales bacterium]